MGIVDHVPGLLGNVSKVLDHRSFQLKLECIFAASISLFPSGLVFGYVLFLPKYRSWLDMDDDKNLLEHNIHFPYILMISSAVITTFLIMLLRLKQKLLIFYHFYILFFAWFLYLLAGILFMRESSGQGNYYK